MCKKITYEKILSKAEVGLLRSNIWEDYFKPVLNEDGNEKTFESSNWDELHNIAIKYAKDETKIYQHIWAVIDTDNINLAVLNGKHICDVVYHIVCEVPWGTGDESDSKLYIEAEY